MAPLKKKLPHNTFRFYAQMYYKRKNTIEPRNSQSMLEVYNTWYSLSESERQQFNRQYNEYKLKYNQHLTNNLKEAEPFMKRKKELNKTQDNCNNSIIATDEEPNMLVEANKLQTEEARETLPWIEQADSDLCDDNETVNLENQANIDEQVIELNDAGLGATSAYKDLQRHTELISEPAPPTVKNGKELYDMFDEDKCTPWALLPQKDKKQYSRAVYLIKKEYITKYRKYLETLTNRELFDYYNKKIF